MPVKIKDSDSDEQSFKHLKNDILMFDGSDFILIRNLDHLQTFLIDNDQSSDPFRR